MKFIAENMDYASAGFAILAAVLWIFSALVKTPNDLSSIKILTLSYNNSQIAGEQMIGEGFVSSSELVDMGKALAKQSALSRWAAASAAAAAISQAASTVWSHWAHAISN